MSEFEMLELMKTLRSLENEKKREEQTAIHDKKFDFVDENLPDFKVTLLPISNYQTLAQKYKLDTATIQQLHQFI